MKTSVPLANVDPALLRSVESSLTQFPVDVRPFDQMPMSMHSHAFVELVYVRAGHGLHRHERHQYAIRKGDCFVILPGESHGYNEGVDLRIVNVLFTPAALQPYLEQLKKVPGFTQFLSLEPLFRTETSFRYKLHCPVSLQRTIEADVSRMLDEQNHSEDGYQVALASLFLQLVIAISRTYSRRFSTPSVRTDMSAKANAVERALAYLETHFDTDVSVNQIASAACLSPSRLSHLFKEATGCSLLGYLVQARLDHACQLLTKSPSRTISAIAFESGFHDPAYFARAFRKAFGKTPLEFRRTAQKS